MYFIMFRFTKACLSSNLLRRNFASAIDINVASIKSIIIRHTDYLDPSADKKVKFQFFDSEKKAIDIEKLESLELTRATGLFSINYKGFNDYSLLLDLPLEPDLQIIVKSEKANVSIEDLQASSIDVKTQNGMVELKNIKSESVNVHSNNGNITSRGIILGQQVNLRTITGDISIENPQGENLIVDGHAVKVKCCYSNNNTFSSSGDTELKSLHGNSTIIAGGTNFFLSGFSGTLHADLNCETVEIQLSEIYMKNTIISNHQQAEVKLGLSEAIINGSAIDIKSNCAIDSTAPELIVCLKDENQYEIRRQNVKDPTGSLQVTVTNGNSLKISRKSWIDSLKLSSAI